MYITKLKESDLDVDTNIIPAYVKENLTGADLVRLTGEYSAVVYMTEQCCYTIDEDAEIGMDITVPVELLVVQSKDRENRSLKQIEALAHQMLQQVVVDMVTLETMGLTELTEVVGVGVVAAETVYERCGENVDASAVGILANELMYDPDMFVVIQKLKENLKRFEAVNGVIFSFENEGGLDGIICKLLELHILFELQANYGREQKDAVKIVRL